MYTYIIHTYVYIWTNNKYDAPPPRLDEGAHAQVGVTGGALGHYIYIYIYIYMYIHKYVFVQRDIYI